MYDWQAEWGYQTLFSCCSSRKAGVAILFNNNCNFQIMKKFSDPAGCFIICDLKTILKNNLQINFCLLLAKHYIWLCKHKTTCPMLNVFLCYFKHIHTFEKNEATVLKKWEPFLPFFWHLLFYSPSCVAN